MLAAVASGCASATRAVETSREPTTIDTVAIRTDTRVLAHDSLGGRGTGSAGARRAARYIASRLEDVGMLPFGGEAGGIDAFMMAVPLLRADVSGATFVVSDGEPRAHGDGFIVGRLGREGLRAMAAPVARLGADSTQVASGAWLLLESSLGEAALRWLPAWRERGVAGLIVRLPADAAVAGYHAQLGHIRWMLQEGPPDPVWQADLPIVMVGPALASELEVPGAHVTFDPRATIDTVLDYNVVGVLAGPNPDRKPVVLTAHYDHLGIMRGAGLRDSIYNGFSDNAAGVAMLLAIASSASAAPPPRPLVFLFAAAEEVGLLGSLHFVRSHPDFVERTHAVLNVDAGAPPAPPTRWRLAAATRSWTLGVAARAVEANGWTHRSDAGSPNSDHWPFVARGVPAVFLVPDGAYENLDDEASQRLGRRWDRYHQPGDEWAPDFPFSGLERYAYLAREIAYALAAEPDR